MMDTWWHELRERCISAEDGHTLVETVAALALLIGVLIPASGAAFQLLIHDGAVEKAEALRIAERTVEQALAAEQPRRRAWRAEEKRWRIVQDVRRHKDLYLVEVRVFPARSRGHVIQSEEIVGKRRALEKKTAPTVMLRAARGVEIP